MTRPNFAVTYTVKNEARLLPQALETGQALGASLIYVFLDESTDETSALIKDKPGIVTYESIRPKQISPCPVWISRISDRWSENMDVRKRINTYFAARHAAQNGIDWLLCIDPDEVMLPSLTSPLDRFSIQDFLRDFDSGPYDQILLRNYEVVPRNVGVENPFVECVTFKNRFPLTDQVWRLSRAALRKLTSNSRLIAWFTYYLYRARLGVGFPITMRDFESKKHIPTGYYLGYWNHKSFIRTKAAEDLIFDVHEWRSEHSRLKSVYRGYLLHYFMYDAESLYEKFNMRPPINTHKGYEYYAVEISRLARSLSLEEFSSFFANNIAITDMATVAKLKDHNVLLEIENLSEFLNKVRTGHGI